LDAAVVVLIVIDQRDGEIERTDACGNAHRGSEMIVNAGEAGLDVDGVEKRRRHIEPHVDFEALINVKLRVGKRAGDAVGLARQQGAVLRDGEGGAGRVEIPVRDRDGIGDVERDLAGGGFESPIETNLARGGGGGLQTEVAHPRGFDAAEGNGVVPLQTEEP